MKLFTIFSLLIIFLSFNQQILAISPQGQDYDLKFTLARKLGFIQETNNVVKEETKNYVLQNKQEEEALSGKVHKKGGDEAVVHVKKGTWQEWKEGMGDNSQFFTMDYTHVRRRRPIHNRFTPAAHDVAP